MGKVDHWDVVNEPFDNQRHHRPPRQLHHTQLRSGPRRNGHLVQPKPAPSMPSQSCSSMTTPFSKAAAARPLIAMNTSASSKGLIARNAPLDGIGLQGHFATALTSPDDLMTLLDRFGAYKELWVTEYDITITDFLLAGDYTRDFMTVLYSHPAVAGFVMWGFWDGAHSKKNAPLFTQDWKLKPAGVAYYDLVFNQWWTCTGAAPTTQAPTWPTAIWVTTRFQ